jgi:signal transduction histidine kinase
MLQAIRRNAGRMTEVLDNLSTLADIRRGDFVAGTDPVDLVALLDGLPARLSAPLAQREVSLDLSRPAWLPAVCGDGRRLQQAFVDLTLGVADRCLAGSSVSVAAAARPGTVLLTIATAASGRPRGHRGVGLAVAAAVLGEHGGRVRSASTGRGLTTVVRLPSRAG